MLLTHKFFNFKANIIMLGGFRLQGYGDEGGVEYEPGDDLHRKMNSADGQPVYSKVNNFDLQVTITVHEMSKAHKRMWQMLKNQMQQPTQLSPLPYKHADPINGDLVRAKHAVFMETPTPDKAREAGEIEYVIDLPNALVDMQLAQGL